jgi:leader peptidase (prepilin peptidase)/N-methyltransferase
VSYLLQKSRCRRCGAAIAASNFWIELVCAALGLICALLFGGWAVIGAAVFCWLLLPLIRLDWQHLWLPDRLILPLALVGVLIGRLVFVELTLADQIFGGIAGFGALELIRRGYLWLRGIDAMGGGDPKLFGAIGLWTGWQALPILLLMASMIGLIHFAARPGTWRQANSLRLPLGSYIGVAAVVWLFALSLLALLP